MTPNQTRALSLGQQIAELLDASGAPHADKAAALSIADELVTVARNAEHDARIEEIDKRIEARATKAD